MRTKYAAAVLVLPFAFVMGLSLMLRAQRTNPASAPPGTFDAVIEQNHGDLFNLDSSSSSEEVLKRMKGARLIKAFNTIYYRRLATEGRTNAPIEDRHAIFVAGDDEGAKAVVMKLIEQIGFAPVDRGSLREGGRRQEPGSFIYNRPLTGRQAKSELAKAVA